MSLLRRSILSTIAVAVLGAPIQAAQPSSKPKWVFLGDSVTAGYGVSQAQAYPALLQAMFPEVEIVNASVSGSTTASAPRRIKWVARGSPSVIVIALGGNDALRGLAPEATEAALDEAVELSRASGAKVVLLGMRAPLNLGPDYRAQFDAVFPRIAKKHGIPLYPFMLEGVALDPELNQDDQIHPNPKGHRVLADRIGAFLKKALVPPSKEAVPQ